MVNLACVVDRSLASARSKLTAFSDATEQDTVSIARLAGDATMNYTTGLVSAGPAVVYTGPAWTSEANAGASEDTGDETSFTETLTVRLPSTAPAVHIDDIVTVTTVGSPLLNREYRVAAVQRNSLVPSVQTLTATGMAQSRRQP